MRFIGENPTSKAARLTLQRRIVLFASILVSGGNFLIPREIVTLLILLILVNSFKVFSFKVSKRNFLIWGWLALVMVLAFVRFQEIDVFQNTIRLTNFVVGLALLRLYVDAGSEYLLEDLRVLTMPMAYQAIATVALAYVAPALFVPLDAKGANLQTFLGVLNFNVTYYSSSFVRPAGFFWEPGVFQIYLNVLLFILFVQHAPLRKIVLAFVAVLATQSTTGVLTATALVIYFSIVPLFSRNRIYRKLVILIAVLVTAPYFFSVVRENLNEKLTGIAAASSVARMYDLQTGLMVVREHPFFGIGFNQFAYTDLAAQLNTDVSGLSAANQENGRLSTNGLLIVLFSVGLPLGSMYLAGFLFQKLMPHKLAFATLLLLSLSTEPLSLTPFFVMFAFSGLRLPRKRSREGASQTGASRPVQV